MIAICGKSVRDTLDELLAPATTALLVIDMQVGGVTKAGAIGRSGNDLSMMPTVRRNCGEAIDVARRGGVTVIHVRVANLPGAASSPPAWLRALRNQSNGRPTDISQLSIEGDPATDFCEECLPVDGEVVITKRRPSAFVGTDLSILLRAQGIESVAVIGVATAGCVEATLRDATHNDFYAVLIEDAVGAYDIDVHEAALTVMRARHDVCRLGDAVKVWQHAKAASQLPVGSGRQGA